MKNFLLGIIFLMVTGSMSLSVCTAQKNTKSSPTSSKSSLPKNQGENPAIQQPKPEKTAPSVKITDSFAGYTYECFMDFYANGVQEKLYIQTDKPYYSAGEKIWFKGYLINAITNAPMRLSKFIYVELINKNDSLITRTKIKADDYGFHNNIPLEAALPQGEYTLRGYTEWMRNDGDKLFFTKKIQIANPIDDAVGNSVAYSKDDAGNIVATVTLRNQSFDPIVAQRLSYTLNVDGKSKRANTRTNDKGEFVITFPKPTDAKANNSIGLVSDDPARAFSRTIFIPVFDDTFDMQFFPEGGHLIPGQLQSVAFKATGIDGLSRPVKGKLFDAEGTLLTEFETSYKGMGRINVMSEVGKKYYVEATIDGRDTVKKFELPEAVATGCAIKMAQLRGKIFYQLLLTPDIDPSNLGVCIHTKGKIIAAERVEADKLSKAMSIENLEEGISQIAVIDIRTAQPIAQRAFFVRKGGGQALIVADKANYARRELVTLDLSVKDRQGLPAKGSFAVAVTDRNSVYLDTLADNIESYLELSSDIRGTVEDPAAYFADNSPETNSNLDLLMMVHGWTRFDIGDVIRYKLPVKEFKFELEHTFAGDVKGFFGNDAKSPSIIVFNPASRYMDMFPLGATNKFTLSGVDYPDSTSLIIQAIGKSGGSKTLTLNIKNPTFPKSKANIAPKIFGSHELQLPQSFISQSKERYYYEGGMRVIDMEGITVTHQEEKRTVMYNMIPTRSMSKETIEQYSGMSLLNALSTMPGVLVTGDAISIRGSSNPPLVYVDQMATELEFASMINMSEVESIDLVLGPEANIFGMGASNGVILIGLKTGASMSGNVRALPSLVNVKHLGYKKPEAFFQPKYELPEKLNDRMPDLRTTICWNPIVVTDSTGVAKVTFYTADNPSTYDVVLEGLTEDGSIVRNIVAVKRE